ncbi:MAG: hypothetical protein WC850_01320 [Candidatus Gracilibacteria bacterium]
MSINCDNGLLKVSIFAEGTKGEEKGCELVLEGSISPVVGNIEEILRLANTILDIEGSKNPQVELSGYEVIQIDFPELGVTYGV